MNVGHIGLAATVAPLADGQAIRLIDNAMHAACRLAVLEVVAMGRKQGLSLAALTEAINQSTGRSRVTQTVLPAILEGRASTDLALERMVKDVDEVITLRARAGTHVHCQLDARNVADRLYESMSGIRFRTGT